MVAFASPLIAPGWGLVKAVHVGGDIAGIAFLCSAIPILALLSTIAFILALLSMFRDVRKRPALWGLLVALTGMALGFPPILQNPSLLSGFWSW